MGWRRDVKAAADAADFTNNAEACKRMIYSELELRRDKISLALQPEAKGVLVVIAMFQNYHERNWMNSCQIGNELVLGEKRWTRWFEEHWDEIAQAVKRMIIECELAT